MSRLSGTANRTRVAVLTADSALEQSLRATFGASGQIELRVISGSMATAPDFVTDDLTVIIIDLDASKPEEMQALERLMLRAGMIKQEAAGIYAWLPLGLRVLRKIEQIVREEQVRAGAVELLMPTLQLADLWRESGRYDAYGPEMLRFQDRGGREMLYGPTNEEMVVDIFRSYVKSYKSLPLNLYQIQWKFRDEVRPRFGVMRVWTTSGPPLAARVSSHSTSGTPTPSLMMFSDMAPT